MPCLTMKTITFYDPQTLYEGTVNCSDYIVVGGRYSHEAGI